MYELLSTGSVAAVRAQGREEWARTGQKERGKIWRVKLMDHLYGEVSR